MAKRKSLAYMLILAGIILPPALMFAISADLPHVFFFTLCGMALSLAMRKPVAYNDRSVIYSLVLALVMAALFDLVFPMRDNRLGYISVFFHPNLLVPFLLYLAVCVSLFEPHERGLGIISACAMVSLMFGGDVFNTHIVGERLPFCAPLVTNIYTVYKVMVGFEILMLGLGLMYWVLPSSRREGVWERRRRTALRAAVFALALLLGLGGLYVYEKNEAAVRRFENYLLRLGVRKFMDQGRGRIEFSREVNLNLTSNAEMQRDFSVIVLRVRGESPPGYLRGRAYLLYGGGQWWSVNTDAGVTFNESVHGGMIAYKTYELEGTKKQTALKKFDVFPASRFSTDRLLLPGNFESVELIADTVTCDGQGSVEVKEWVRDGAYSYYVPEPRQEAAWNLPSPPKLADYLQTPENLWETLDGVNKEIYKNAKPGLKDSERIARLLEYFRGNFKYSLDTKPEAGIDPVAGFLTRTRAGHCELFASATALLLRRQGIPCRYITGFMCEEKHPSEAYYVSRVGNAHAWLEAYPADLGQWKLVEPTPASGVPNYRHDWGMAERWRDRLGHMFNETLALLRRGVVARAIVNAASGVWNLFRDLLGDPVRGTLFVLLVLTTGYFIRKRLRRRRGIQAAALELPPGLERLRGAFMIFERRMGRRYGMTRAPGETVDEWMGRLEERAALSVELKALLSEYRALRFSGSEPSAAEVAKLRRRLRRTR